MSGRDVIVIIVVALGILIMSFAGVLFVPWRGWGMMGYMPMMGYGTMFVVPVLLLALLGVGVYYALKGVSSGGRQESGRVLDIVKERYAKGEISKEQYEQLKKDLE